MRDSLKRFQKALFTRELLIWGWFPVVLITLAHYAIPSHIHWPHHLFRRLYYLPIIYASIRGGMKAGLAVALVVIATYLPHAFFNISRHDPGAGIEKLLEIVIYVGAAIVGGILSEREKRQRRAAQAALKRQQELLDQLVRAGRLSALGEVVAGIAHEIKNPLHSLLGTAEIVDPLIDKGLPERRLWDNHVKELERLRRTSERFLSLASPPSTEFKVLDLRDVARRIEALVSAECRQRGITLTVDLPVERVPVMGNEDQLVQVGLNIALNAMHAMEQVGDSLAVSLTRTKRSGTPMAAMSFKNNGPPISKEEEEEIFVPFHTTRKEGTGLGLSISLQISHYHGGFIESESSEEGVCFTVCLPEPEI